MGAGLKMMLALSLAGSALILLLWAAKPLTRRLFGSRWQYYIWLVALIVMVTPISISLPVRAPSIVTTRPGGTEAAAEQPAIAAAPENVPVTPAAPPDTPNPLLENGRVPVANGRSVSLLWLIDAVWLVGCLLFLGAGLVSYARFLHNIRKHAADTNCPALKQQCEALGIRTKICVKTTDMLNAPMLTGVFRPVLLLPQREIDAQQMRFILLHELTHYKRRDLWYKWFAFLVNALHWFNPLIYLAVRQINEECEISCDLAVTAHMDEAEKAGYMGTILQLAAGQQKEEKR